MTSGNALGKSSRRYRDSYLHNFSGNLILDKLLAAKRNIFQQNELDLDQSVRSYAQLFDVVDPNYYEFEAHIFFDDAFEYSELENDFKLVTAAILTCIYTLSMILVVIGLILKMAEEGICAPTTIFFLFLLGIFISAGLLHPLEIWNIIHGPIYLLTSPCSGMLMIIYAICNMNKISWGTRESRYQASQQKAQEEKAKLSRNKKWWSFLKRKSDKPFSLAELLTCKCCCKASDITEDMKMNTILDKLDMIEKRIENLPKSGNYSLEGSNISSTFNSSAPNDSGKGRTSHTRRSKTDRREGSGK
ncbi:Hypothetical predicted protein [Octopus vulgaris]|uniref:Uncharacterized protein n=1 Tax=Octopus vulgaris TaxID=6645 RepID=A0AA36BQJ8_OCTVU|nr:Hypothetical predicted protein [Octopus vulgaris]